jgi:hypothetical protein
VRHTEARHVARAGPRQPIRVRGAHLKGWGRRAGAWRYPPRTKEICKSRLERCVPGKTRGRGKSRQGPPHLIPSTSYTHTFWKEKGVPSGHQRQEL